MTVDLKKLRELIDEWRAYPSLYSMNGPRENDAYHRCANQLEKILEAKVVAPPAPQVYIGTQDDYCKICGKFVMEPNVAYGVNPDAVCNCARG